MHPSFEETTGPSAPHPFTKQCTIIFLCEIESLVRNSIAHCLSPFSSLGSDHYGPGRQALVVQGALLGEHGKLLTYLWSSIQSFD